jgi:hypothetical protein
MVAPQQPLDTGTFYPLSSVSCFCMVRSSTSLNQLNQYRAWYSVSAKGMLVDRLSESQNQESLRSSLVPQSLKPQNQTHSLGHGALELSGQLEETKGFGF